LGVLKGGSRISRERLNRHGEREKREIMTTTNNLKLSDVTCYEPCNKNII
jgi:hypothetical protein